MAISSKKRKEKQEKQQQKKQVVLLTKEDFHKDSSAILLKKKGTTTGQLTENSIVFNMGDIELHLSLFFDSKSPKNFNVLEWYNRKAFEKKVTMCKLLEKIIDDKINNDFNAKTNIHLLTSDVAEGEDKNIIAYYIEIINYNYFKNVA